MADVAPSRSAILELRDERLSERLTAANDVEHVDGAILRRRSAGAPASVKSLAVASKSAAGAMARARSSQAARLAWKAASSVFPSAPRRVVRPPARAAQKASRSRVEGGTSSFAEAKRATSTTNRTGTR